MSARSYARGFITPGVSDTKSNFGRSTTRVSEPRPFSFPVLLPLTPRHLRHHSTSGNLRLQAQTRVRARERIYADSYSDDYLIAHTDACVEAHRVIRLPRFKKKDGESAQNTRADASNKNIAYIRASSDSRMSEVTNNLSWKTGAQTNRTRWQRGQGNVGGGERDEL